MKTAQGFTLIELIVFIVVTAILSTTIMIAFINVMQGLPTVSQQIGATKIAEQCMEWFIGQRVTQGYSSIATGSTVPSYCTVAGYTVAVNVAATTINSDSNYKTITVTVSGSGNATLTTLVADF